MVVRELVSMEGAVIVFANSVVHVYVFAKVGFRLWFGGFMQVRWVRHLKSLAMAYEAIVACCEATNFS